MDRDGKTDDRDIWNAPHAVRFPNGRWETVLSRAMWRQLAGGRTEFALPYAPDRPWPLPELFCFAAVRTVGDRRCIVYAFDGGRRPVF